MEDLLAYSVDKNSSVSVLFPNSLASNFFGQKDAFVKIDQRLSSFRTTLECLNEWKSQKGFPSLFKIEIGVISIQANWFTVGCCTQETAEWLSKFYFDFENRDSSENPEQCPLLMIARDTNSNVSYTLIPRHNKGLIMCGDSLNALIINAVYFNFEAQVIGENLSTSYEGLKKVSKQLEQDFGATERRIRYTVSATNSL
jgi:hypothetical protein